MRSQTCHRTKGDGCLRQDVQRGGGCSTLADKEFTQRRSLQQAAGTRAALSIRRPEISATTSNLSETSLEIKVWCDCLCTHAQSIVHTPGGSPS